MRPAEEPLERLRQGGRRQRPGGEDGEVRRDVGDLLAHDAHPGQRSQNLLGFRFEFLGDLNGPRGEFEPDADCALIHRDLFHQAKRDDIP